MSVVAVADAFDGTVGPACVGVEAVLDGVPGKWCSGESLGSVVDFAGA
jgi:hypothetical protein